MEPLGGMVNTRLRVIVMYVFLFFSFMILFTNTLLSQLHCKKERAVLTNFGHLSCTHNCCKLMGKVSKTCIRT